MTGRPEGKEQRTVDGKAATARQSLSDRSTPTDLADERLSHSLAWLTLHALETQRRSDGVDEWDEADPRTLAYVMAHEIAGEDTYAEICQLVTRERES